MSVRTTATKTVRQLTRARFTQRMRKALTTVLPYRKMAGGRRLLDAEYARGGWDYLWGPGELARFSVVAGRCQRFTPAPRILEIGCGEGILRARLDTSKIAGFVGVDISEEAVRRATARASDDLTTFVRADAATFVPDGRFDIVVFNECLEYFDDPVALVRRFERYLATGGEIVVSMFAGTHTARTRHIWKRLEAVHAPVDSTRVTNHDGFTWIIKTFRPGATVESE